MSDVNLNENKIRILKTAVPVAPDYEISADMGQGLSEERKKSIEDNIRKFLDDYL